MPKLRGKISLLSNPAGRVFFRRDENGNPFYDYGNGVVFASTGYTMTTSDDVVLCNFATTDLVVLSTPPIAGKLYTVKKIGGAGNITVTANAGKTIDGLGSVGITTLDESLTFIYDGTNFRTIGMYNNAAEYRGSIEYTTGITATWSGTAPSAVTYVWRWTQVGLLTTVEVSFAGTAAQTSTGVEFNLPVQAPTPDEFTANNVGQFAATCAPFTSAGALVAQARGGVRRTGAFTFRIVGAWASNTVQQVAFSFTYRAVFNTGSLDAS